MKKVLLAGVAFVAFTMGAHAAEYECNAPTVYPADNDPNPVVSVEVNYDPSEHAWQVFHHRQDGSVVSRGQQYAMVDYSDQTRMEWGGTLNRNRQISMRAGMKRDQRGGLLYAEEIRNSAHGNVLETQITAPCHEKVVYRDVPPQPGAGQQGEYRESHDYHGVPVQPGTVIEHTIPQYVQQPAPQPQYIPVPPSVIIVR